ncbi:MAG: bifunctional riboflavin kinase/FAD synthetase [Prochlorothrix sp.]
MRAALGNFDGIHLGHRQVIAPVLPPSAPAPGSDLDTLRIYSTVLTFSPHPKEFFSGQPKALLTPVEEKAQYLDRLGVEQLVLLPFNRELATLSPEDFIEQVLVQKLRVQCLSVGQDFCFGAKRSGTAEHLQAIAARYNIPVVITPLQSLNQERISSSAIRDALMMGDVARAQGLLGRPYVIQGEVVRGQQLGRTLGFPTANLKLPHQKFVPRQGVYGVWVCNLSAPTWPPMAGVMNIGTRPTIVGQNQTLEVHIFPQTLQAAPSPDPPQLPPLNLYGQTLAVELVKFLRPEHKFNSLDELKAQIAKDCAIARELLLKTPT